MYGFYCNEAVAHKLAIRYNRSHNASHNVISECISLPVIVFSYFKQRSFDITTVQFVIRAMLVNRIRTILLKIDRLFRVQCYGHLLEF